MRNMYIISWFDISTLKHLRFPFSFFLMPVFLFALSQAESIHWGKALIAFILLHVLVFPSSNGYNSYQDRDTTSIGGLKNPPQVSEHLFYATLLFDIVAVVAALFVSVFFSVTVLVFILVSRAYSYRGIRLKKYPVIGFLTVCLFQGAFVYLMSYSAITTGIPLKVDGHLLLAMCISSLFMGSMFPLTQIYQHEADKKDGVISISYWLGYHGTFVFSAVLFFTATLLMSFFFLISNQFISFILFVFAAIPSVIKILVWFGKVKKDVSQANFENTMSVNLLTSACMNLYFIILICNRYEFWF